MLTEPFTKIFSSEFDYNLPESKIAQVPVDKRDTSKLLVFENGKISDDRFFNIANYFESEDLIVMNDTRVIKARLHFSKTTGSQIEIFCLEPYEPTDYSLSFAQREKCSWKCLVGNLKKWKSGKLRIQSKIKNAEFELNAEMLNKGTESHIIGFSWFPKDFSFAEVIENVGIVPLPPYLNREAIESDAEKYQTTYSQNSGSVAAPTAGLHFTQEIFENLKQKNVLTDFVTLHVGAGTFIPLRTDEIQQHTMHCEHFVVSSQLVNNLLNHKKRLITVGTTTIRTLETLYWFGVKLCENKKSFSPHLAQWEAYTLSQNISFSDSMIALLNYFDENRIANLYASTNIMIIPAYRFRMSDLLITNFHQPKSTLLTLVAAYVGNSWKEIYQHALNNNYRFLSYGDSSLLYKIKPE